MYNFEHIKNLTFQFFHLMLGMELLDNSYVPGWIKYSKKQHLLLTLVRKTHFVYIFNYLPPYSKIAGSTFAIFIQNFKISNDFRLPFLKSPVIFKDPALIWVISIHVLNVWVPLQPILVTKIGSKIGNDSIVDPLEEDPSSTSVMVKLLKQKIRLAFLAAIFDESSTIF